MWIKAIWVLGLFYLGSGVNITSLNDLNKFSFEIPSIEALLQYAHNVTTDLNPCMGALQELFVGIMKKEQWALKVLDSSTKLQSGIMEANIADYGQYDECLSVRSPSATFKGKFCFVATKFPHALLQFLDEQKSAFLKSSVDVSVLLRAVCIPSTCSIEEILNYVRKAIKGTPLQNIELAAPYNCETDDPIESTTYEIVVISVMVVLILWASFCTTIHICRRHKATPFLIEIFSMRKNLTSLFRTEAPKESTVTCLNGIRICCLFWVISVHRMVLCGFSMMNINEASIPDIFRTLPGQIIISGQIAVDSFLHLSGLLVTYLLVKQYKKTNGRVSWPAVFVHRYVRLTVALGFMLILNTSLVKYLGSGPIYQTSIESVLTVNCDTYWWSVLLYIQNYVNPTELCMGHTWYLSVDMQLFLVSPIIVIILAKTNPKFGYSFLLILTIISHIPVYLTVTEKNIKTASFALGQGVTLEDSNNWNAYYYSATHTKLVPWVIGMCCGYILLQVKPTKKMNKAFVTFMWAYATISCIGSVLSMYPFVQESYVYNPFWDHFHLISVRVFWGIGLSWIIIACYTGYGGPVNWFFSLNCWTPFCRISYGMYLIHVFRQEIQQFSNYTTQYFSMGEMFSLITVDVVYTSFYATLLYLFVESPLFHLESAMWKVVMKEKKSIKIEPMTNETDEKITTIHVIYKDSL